MKWSAANFSYQVESEWLKNPALWCLMLFSALTLTASAISLSVDHRLINGELAWVKPIKFSASFGIYSLTLILFSRYLTKHKSFFRKICWAAFAGATTEIFAITLQVLRGAESHFNTSTAFDHCIFMTVTVAILPVAFSILALFAFLLQEKNLPDSIGLSLKWGLFLTIIGLLPGVLMLLPEPIKMHVFGFANLSRAISAHHIPTKRLPFLGWNEINGDLRVAHFIGIHAMQVLPVCALLLQKLGKDMLPQRQRMLITNIGFAYLEVIILLTWQALRSEPFTNPGTLTLRVAFTTLAVHLLSCGGVCLATRYNPNLSFPATRALRSRI